MFVFSAEDLTATARLARGVASLLQQGDVFALNGNLGAGKTQFVRDVAAACGCDPAAVTSPTFVLAQEYRDGQLPLYHFDAYRLADSDEFLALGADELLFGDGVCFVEWADRVADVIPPAAWTIAIEHRGDTAREFTIDGPSDRLKQLSESCFE